MRHPTVVAFVLAAAVSACSFLAFDDYTSDPVAPETDAGADVVAPSADASPDGLDSDASSSDPYGDVVRADSPVAWYRFEENETDNAAKDSAGTRTANLRGGSMGFGAQGISGRGIRTMGTGSGFTLGNDLGFAGTTSFSLEVWVKPTEQNIEHRLVEKRESVTGGLSGWILYLNPDFSPRFENWGTEIASSGSAPIPAGYVHVVATVSFTGAAGASRLYINAQPQPNNTADSNASTPATQAELALLATFAGDADELAIYDKALTPERVQAHYLAGKP